MKNNNIFLFINKIWFWLTCIPCFYLIYNGIVYKNADWQVAMIVGCVLVGSTLLQELLYSLKIKNLRTVQKTISYIKLIAYLAVYAFFILLLIGSGNWTMITLFFLFCAVALAGCLLEKANITKSYASLS